MFILQDDCKATVDRMLSTSLPAWSYPLQMTNNTMGTETAYLSWPDIAIRRSMRWTVGISLPLPYKLGIERYPQALVRVVLTDIKIDNPS